MSTAPKQARSIATRRKLLDATVGLLIERGYAGTSTTAVAKRAGVSQGAVFKHFESKIALMGAATEHLFAQMIDGYRMAFAALAAEEIADVHARLDKGLSLLWVVFESGPLQAALELYVAARTEPALASVLEPILEAHSENLTAEAKQLFPEVADHPALPSLVAGIMAGMQGAAVVAPILGRAGRADERTFLARIAAREMTEALQEMSR